MTSQLYRFEVLHESLKNQDGVWYPFATDLCHAVKDMWPTPHHCAIARRRMFHGQYRRPVRMFKENKA